MSAGAAVVAVPNWPESMVDCLLESVLVHGEKWSTVAMRVSKRSAPNRSGSSRYLCYKRCKMMAGLVGDFCWETATESVLLGSNCQSSLLMYYEAFEAIPFSTEQSLERKKSVQFSEAQDNLLVEGFERHVTDSTFSWEDVAQFVGLEMKSCYDRVRTLSASAASWNEEQVCVLRAMMASKRSCWEDIAAASHNTAQRLISSRHQFENDWSRIAVEVSSVTGMKASDVSVERDASKLVSVKTAWTEELDDRLMKAIKRFGREDSSSSSDSSSDSSEEEEEEEEADDRVSICSENDSVSGDEDDDSLQSLSEALARVPLGSTVTGLLRATNTLSKDARILLFNSLV
eukprot:gene29263-36283_t